MEELLPLKVYRYIRKTQIIINGCCVFMSNDYMLFCMHTLCHIAGKRREGLGFGWGSQTAVTLVMRNASFVSGLLPPCSEQKNNKNKK